MARNKVIKEPEFTIPELLELLDKAFSDVRFYSENADKMYNCKRYAEDFIHFKKLDEEYEYFCEHAIEDPDEELPFPHLILP